MSSSFAASDKGKVLQRFLPALSSSKLQIGLISVQLPDRLEFNDGTVFCD